MTFEELKRKYEGRVYRVKGGMGGNGPDDYVLLEELTSPTAGTSRYLDGPRKGETWEWSSWDSAGHESVGNTDNVEFLHFHGVKIEFYL